MLSSQTWGPELKSSGPTLKSQCGHRSGCNSEARMDWERRACWLPASVQVQREALPQGNTMESYRGKDTWHPLRPPRAHSAHTHVHIRPPKYACECNNNNIVESNWKISGIKFWPPHACINTPKQACTQVYTYTQTRTQACIYTHKIDTNLS